MPQPFIDKPLARKYVDLLIQWHDLAAEEF